MSDDETSAAAENVAALQARAEQLRAETEATERELEAARLRQYQLQQLDALMVEVCVCLTGKCTSDTLINRWGDNKDILALAREKLDALSHVLSDAIDSDDDSEPATAASAAAPEDPTTPPPATMPRPERAAQTPAEPAPSVTAPEPAESEAAYTPPDDAVHDAELVDESPAVPFSEPDPSEGLQGRAARHSTRPDRDTQFNEARAAALQMEKDGENPDAIVTKLAAEYPVAVVRQVQREVISKMGAKS